ncbi:MAG: phosphoenolpyruvate--protein phosphotransferase [Gammaproteobacteria bacterium]|nr:MAG: phosphoenolpyruvate--protein phosphotransferase [Gammaproteobacteria bacterium]
MTLQLDGIGVSSGIAIGGAYLLTRGQLKIARKLLSDEGVKPEIKRYRKAVKSARRQLKELSGRIPKNTPADIGAFIETHLLMLGDAALTEVPARIIREQLCNAEWALKNHCDALLSVFDEIDDSYLRTRRDDVIHVINRIQRILLHGDSESDQLTESEGDSHRIIIADDLSPADTVNLHERGVAAFVTEYGGPLSHSAIMAKSLRIPAVVGVRNALRLLEDGEQLIVDGHHGVIIANADRRTLSFYRKRQKEDQRRVASLKKLKKQKAQTLDGIPIQLQANVELHEDLTAVRAAGGAAVGLYRTEYLFMNRSEPPDEEEQFQSYLKVVKSVKGATVTIRTLDLGADKQIDGKRDGCQSATNPALGLRAIRLCLKEPSLFRPQLRAILRISTAGPVRILIPMLSTITELRQVIAQIKQAKSELDAKHIRYDPNIPIGAMIEIPAAAIAVNSFTDEIDFLSIGTNDLIQYTLAIDRVDDTVNYLYDPLHPAVLSLIDHVIQIGRKTGKPVNMCGEMAGDPRFTRLLLGMGLTEFSMHPSSLLEVKNVVLNSKLSDLKRLTKRILKSSEPEVITKYLNVLNTKP